MNRAGISTALPNAASPSLTPLISNYDQNDDDGDLSVPQTSLSWDQLRRQARQVENEIELKLASLSKLGASVASPANKDAIALNMMGKPSQELELEDLLKKLQNIIQSMGNVLNRQSATPTSHSMIHMLERHKEILFDYNKEFRRVKTSIRSARDKADLMNQIQDEIRISNANQNDEANYYLSERGRIEQSHRMTDSILEQAYAARQDISRQGRTLRSVNNRIAGVLGRIPGINHLLNRIDTRRKRDTLIMAAVISTCIILILLYVMHT